MVIQKLRKSLWQELQNPTYFVTKLFYGLIIVLIFLSIALAAFMTRHEAWANLYENLLSGLEGTILVVFSAEFIMRAWAAPSLRDYVLRFEGVIDLLAILPSLLFFFTPEAPFLAWIRVFRLFRLFKMIKLFYFQSYFQGVLPRISVQVLPFIALGLAFKAIMLILEPQPWWFEPSVLREATKELTTAFGIVIGVLLGNMLNHDHTMKLSIESSLSALVSSFKAAEPCFDNPNKMHDWAKMTYDWLYGRISDEQYNHQVNQWGYDLKRAEVDGDVIRNLMQQVFYLRQRHQLNTTPRYYRNFLKNITIVYIAWIIIVMSGFFGFIATALVIYVLGGLYMIVEEFDIFERHNRERFLFNPDISQLERMLNDYQRYGSTHEEGGHNG